MKIINEPLLAQFRNAPRCEHCGRVNRTGLDPAHVFARGLGGGGRMDVKLNLVSLCRLCHQSQHDGHISRATMLGLVAKREGLTAEEVEQHLRELQRCETKSH